MGLFNGPGTQMPQYSVSLCNGASVKTEVTKKFTFSYVWK